MNDILTELHILDKDDKLKSSRQKLKVKAYKIRVIEIKD